VGVLVVLTSEPPRVWPRDEDHAHQIECGTRAKELPAIRCGTIRMNVPSERPTASAAAGGTSGSSLAAATPPPAVREVFAEEEIPEDQPTAAERVKTLLVGRPLDLADRGVYQHISLIAFLAWVGLGADGLSSSCYGPAEAFEHLEGHTYLAVFLALATMFTVAVISACYSRLIEVFPSGGGGYLVASKMLGAKVGAVAGCALLVDYVLTVTVSIAAAGDALFGLVGLVGSWKVWAESAAVVGLVVLNLRGVRESVTVLMPIFLTFLVTHAVLIAGTLGIHLGEVVPLVQDITQHMRTDLADPRVGWLVVLGMFLKAYSLGAGTYTGIEAVSNSMAVMREPRVVTAQRTMRYMAVSLAITAGGLLVGYLLMELDLKADGQTLKGLRESTGRTMNDLLVGWFAESTLPRPLAPLFRWLTVLAEATLLVVAAQAGFIGGPKCLAMMAHDSWVPHWFGSLSERLASHNGIMLIGASSLAALWATDGNVSALVVMYSINVFVTFSLSMIGMTLHWVHHRHRQGAWRSLALFTFGAVLCVSILAITTAFKFQEGAWKTVVATGGLTGLALLIRRYYQNVNMRLKGLDESLGTIEVQGPPNLAPPDPQQPTAVILVGGYSGLGVHTLLNAIRFVPHYFKNIVFVSVGVVDSGNFKGIEELEGLRRHVQRSLEQYVDLARRLGYPSTSYMAIGTDVVDELEQLCRVVYRDFPKSVVFAGQLVFQRQTWYGALLHNQTAYSLQRRLQWDGIPMVILPTRVRDAPPARTASAR
jgi:amino acid transporter